MKFGENIIELSDVEQLIELSQLKTIGEALLKINDLIDNKKSIKEIIKIVMGSIEKDGLDCLSEKKAGNFTQFRGIDLAFTINRLRSLKIL